MSDKVKITWRVSDGYVNNGPHTLVYDREEWDELTDDERQQRVYQDAMQEISIDWKESK